MIKFSKFITEEDSKRPFKGHDWGYTDGVLMHNDRKARKSTKIKGELKRLYVYQDGQAKLNIIAQTVDDSTTILVKKIPNSTGGRAAAYNDIATLAYLYGLKPEEPGDQFTDYVK